MKITKTTIWRKLCEWVIRYIPAEIGGTVIAVVAAWIAHAMTGSLVVAAICGTIGENIGFYGVAAGRDMLRYWRVHRGHAHMRRAWLTGAHTIRGMVVEFGVAEVFDSFLVRPGLFYLIPALFGGNLVVGLLVAKVLADIIFYGFAITGYEFRKSRFDKETVKGEQT